MILINDSDRGILPMDWLKETGFFKHICWAERRDNRQSQKLPDWASFLIWLGATMKRLQFEDMRIFCVVLLPTRICGSALSAFGSLSNSLTNPNNELSWNLFLECENGLRVYFLHADRDGSRKQVEGELGNVIYINDQKLRSIRIISNRKNLQKLTLHIGESTFRDIKVAFHPHYRTRLLNHLHDLSDLFSRILADFNENSLLMHNTESFVITNRARWVRENEEVLLGIVEEGAPNLLPLKEIILTSFGRTLLCSPKSRELETIKGPLAILDGLDALRSRESIQARNLLILLDQEEFEEEAEDMLTHFSGYCLRKLPADFDQLPTGCPDGIDVQFYCFSDRGLS